MLGRSEWLCFLCVCAHSALSWGIRQRSLRAPVLFSLKGSKIECRKHPSADSRGHAGSGPCDLFYPSHPLRECSGMLIASSLALGLPSLVLMPHPAGAYGQSLILAAFCSPSNFRWPEEVEVMVKYASLPPCLTHNRNSGHTYAGTAQPAT